MANEENKKKGVSSKRKDKAKKVIKQAILDVKKPPSVFSLKAYSDSGSKNNSVKYNNDGYSISGGGTHSSTRGKAILKNIKSKVAKRGAAKSKKK